MLLPGCSSVKYLPDSSAFQASSADKLAVAVSSANLFWDLGLKFSNSDGIPSGNNQGLRRVRHSLDGYFSCPAESYAIGGKVLKLRLPQLLPQEPVVLENILSPQKIPRFLNN